MALLVDGLQAEREQGITIDVAYRYLLDRKRKFIVADTPGHEQYTRNMATGASTAELAVLLVDARKGLLTQTRRHSHHRLAARHPPRRPRRQQDGLGRLGQRDSSASVREYLGLRREARICRRRLHSRFRALNGDNVTRASDADALVRRADLARPSRNHRGRSDRARQAVPHAGAMGQSPELDFRGFCGTIVAGRVRPGDRVALLPAGKAVEVARIVSSGGDLAEAAAGQRSCSRSPKRSM